MSRRHLLLALALLASAAWSAWVLTQDDDTLVQAAPRSRQGAATPDRESAAAQPARAGAAPSAASPARDAALLATLESAGGRGAAPLNALAEVDGADRPLPPERPHNLFGEYSYEPPKPKAAPPPPEVPHAPPLGLTYTGRLDVEGRTTYLFDHGGRPLELVLGAAFGEFQLVQADSRQLVFLHGPTGERVSLSIASNPGS